VSPPLGIIFGLLVGFVAVQVPIKSSRCWTAANSGADI
jgi:hypothetical protein